MAPAVNGSEAKSLRALDPTPATAAARGPSVTLSGSDSIYTSFVPRQVQSVGKATYKLFTSLSPASSSCRSLIWRLPGNLGFWKGGRGT